MRLLIRSTQLSFGRSTSQATTYSPATDRTPPMVRTVRAAAVATRRLPNGSQPKPHLPLASGLLRRLPHRGPLIPGELRL